MPLVSPLKVNSPPSTPEEKNPFEFFFRDSVYLEFKNHLYNYLRRREEIRWFLKEDRGTVLEIGSGVSPIVPIGKNVIYSDTSKEAMRLVKENQGAEKVVTMSGTDISLKDETIPTIVCSEVIEHIKDDQKALREMARVLKTGGALILTVPAHEYYYSYDDSFVQHERRYAIQPLLRRLRNLGFTRFKLSKVTGLLEKITMLLAVLVFKAITWMMGAKRRVPSSRHPFLKAALPIYKAANGLYAQVVKWEAKLIPLSLATIVLIHCRKGAPQKSS